VRHGNILYFAHPVFRHYRIYGAVANREFIARAIRSFLGESISLSTNLPSTARVALTSQLEERRHVLHVLYAPAIHRGGNIQLLGGKGVEVIEDLPPLHDVEVTLQSSVTSARLVPQGGDVTLEKSGDRVTFRVPVFSCHQMIEIEC
jgi:hypothetical protein